MIGVVATAACVIFVGMSLLFAADYPRSNAKPPAFVLTDAVLQLLNTTHVSELVAVRVNRGDLSKAMVKGLGAVIWLPFLVGCVTFIVLLLSYAHLKLDILWPAMLVIVGVLMIWWFEWVTVGGGVIIGGVLLPLALACVSEWVDGKAGQDRPSRGRRWSLAFHIMIATLVFFSAVALSLTTHIILTSYSGFRPASQVERAELQSLFARLTHERVPGDAGDAVSWHLSKIPSLNEMSSLPVTIFAVNHLAAVSYVVSTTLYLVVVWVLLIPEGSRSWRGPRRAYSFLRSKSTAKEQDNEIREGEESQRFAKVVRVLMPRAKPSGASLPHTARVIFAIPFYLSVGIAFAILYFNIYIAAAAKQNEMLLYADFMQMSDEEYGQLLAIKDSFGPTEWLMKRMLDLKRDRGDKDVSRILSAARARYWPSAVIAQELPRVTTSSTGEQGAAPEVAAAREGSATQMLLDPQLTFTDMLYFSFVSFTTTGYGDIRPISDELRLWTVCENIIEVLFTAMFFTVAMGRLK